VNDQDFLSLLREEARQEFADDLYGRLIQANEKRRRTTRSGTFRKRFAFRPVLVLAASLALTASVAAAASPDVRGAVTGLFHEVGHLLYHEQQSPSIIGLVAGTPTAVQTPDDRTPTQLPEPAAGGGQPIVFQEAIDRQHAFGLDFPVRVPAGFTPAPTASANAGTNQGVSEFRWHDHAGHTLIFATVVRPGGSSPGVFPVGTGALTEVDINGFPGALIRGDWDERGQWNAAAGVRVRWTKGNAEYELSVDDPSAGDSLLTMARSATP
jgi:hypothetical protein